MNNIQDFINTYGIEQKFVDKIFISISNNTDVYIDEWLLNYIGYENERDRDNKKQYLDLLKHNFKEDIDYKLLKTSTFKETYPDTKVNLRIFEESNINSGNSVKHLIVKPKCFKASLLKMRTDKAREVIEYYLILEDACKEFCKLQLEEAKKQLEQKDKELEETKRQVVDMSSNIYNKLKKKENNSYFYGAQNKQNAIYNNIKLGIANSLDSRKATLNTSINPKDPLKFCYSAYIHNAKYFEERISYYIAKLKVDPNREFYSIPFDLLKPYLDKSIELYKLEVENYNSLVDSIQEYSFKNENKVDKDRDENKIKYKVENEIKIELTKDKTEVDKEVEEYENENSFIHSNGLKYSTFYTEDNIKKFKCLQCNKLFGRKDNIICHLNRTVKCNDTKLQDLIQSIINNKDNPEIKNFNENEKYQYIQTYDEIDNFIKYECYHCKVSYANPNRLKEHFILRKNKCYDQNQFDNINENEILLYNNGERDCEYYKCLKNNDVYYICKYCNLVFFYKKKGDLHRHFNNKKKCYKEKEQHNLYTKIEDNTFKCNQCDKIYKNSQGAMRHIREKHK